MRTIALAACIALAIAPGLASARDIPAAGMTAEEVLAFLQAHGLNARIETDKGDLHVQVTSVKDPNFGVYLFDCKDGRCGALQFAAGFNTHGADAPGSLNDWNHNKRWGRSYSDSVNDPWVEMDVDITPGGTYELLEDELSTWNKVVGDFVEYIHFTK